MRSVILVACLATELGAQWTHPSCPLPVGSRGYPVTASSVALDSATLTRIARGVAADLPSDSTFNGRAQRYALAELMRRMPRSEIHTRGHWVPSESDTITAILRYRRGADVLASVDTTTSRFGRRVARAIAAQVARARSSYVQHDTIPLRIDTADSADVTVRFGYEPQAGDVVTRFSRIETNVAPGRNLVGPEYPDRLRQQGVEGAVLTAFIVREDGSVDRNAIRVLRTSDLEFTESVRKFIRYANFLPATVDCHRVPDIVQQPFNFTLAR